MVETNFLRPHLAALLAPMLLLASPVLAAPVEGSPGLAGALTFAPRAAADLAWHAVPLEYLPFVALIFARFTVGGSIVVAGGPWGRPAAKTLLLAAGTGFASLTGRTGAARVLVHPLLAAKAHRSRKVHLVVVFILLFASVGGSLTSPGDPPLFPGFLKGLSFFWSTTLLAPVPGCMGWSVVLMLPSLPVVTWVFFR